MCVSGCGKPLLLWVGSSHRSNNKVHTTLPAGLIISQCDIVTLLWRTGELLTQTLIFALRVCLAYEHTLRSDVRRRGDNTGSIRLFLWWFSLYVTPLSFWVDTHRFFLLDSPADVNSGSHRLEQHGKPDRETTRNRFRSAALVLLFHQHDI